MIFGAKTQNETLKKAGSQPKDTSHRKENADRYSGKIVSQKNTKSKDFNDNKEIKKIDNGSDKLKGSYEGLMHSSSTTLQMSGRGYDSKSLQKARYDKSFASHNDNRFTFNNAPLNKNYSIMDNYSSTSRGSSSSSAINNIVKKNNIFQ